LAAAIPLAQPCALTYSLWGHWKKFSTTKGAQIRAAQGVIKRFKYCLQELNPKEALQKNAHSIFVPKPSLT
jgi:hypothetical protein